MATVSDIAKLYTLLTGESERVFREQFTDEQATALAANIDHYLSSNDIFGSADLAADASALTPEVVFSGIAGTAKLCDWVEGNISTIEADPACAAVLALWGAENIEAVADADGGEVAIVGHVATNFSPSLGIQAFEDAFNAYVATNILTIAAANEAALVTGGWVAPGE